MKARIIGVILVLVVLGVLFVLTESTLTTTTDNSTISVPATQSHSDNDFKNLKIN